MSHTVSSLIRRPTSVRRRVPYNKYLSQHQPVFSIATGCLLCGNWKPYRWSPCNLETNEETQMSLSPTTSPAHSISLTLDSLELANTYERVSTRQFDHGKVLIAAL